MRPIIIILILAAASGCQSYSSTILNRLEDNTFFGNSNGNPKEHCSARPYKGIPIALKVPTHLDVYIDEIYYIKLDPDSGKATDSAECGCRLYHVRTELIKTEKIFTVDFKRPAAGVLDLKMTFTDEQYFQKVISNLQDDTINQSAALAATVISSIRAVSASTDNSEDSEKFMKDHQIDRRQRVVGYQRFDLNSVDFEAQVEGFVAAYLNGCDICGNGIASTCPNGTCKGENLTAEAAPAAAVQAAAPAELNTETFKGSLKFNIDANPIQPEGDLPAGTKLNGKFDFSGTRTQSK